jgi:mannose-6-phosphate isomerase-like protein (cupin superfamily)
VLPPGGEQRLRAHAPEQVYVILEGRGEMTVADDMREVTAGECVFVPSARPHGLVNRGAGVLRYLSASAPAFTRAELEAWWPLASEDQERVPGR